MIGLTADKQCTKDDMIDKLLNDPDKFERMFAARYLFKYNFSESRSILEDALKDNDPEVAICIARLFEVKGK